jgi:hypothetical protein
MLSKLSVRLLLCLTLAIPFASVNAQNLAVRPVLECVEPNFDGVTYIAFFGYKNDNSVAVEIPVGPSNKFTPSPIDRGQTTVFEPGRFRFAYSVVFDGNNLVWTLTSPNGSRRTSTASRNSARCNFGGET